MTWYVFWKIDALLDSYEIHCHEILFGNVNIPQFLCFGQILSISQFDNYAQGWQMPWKQDIEHCELAIAMLQWVPIKTGCGN